MTDLQVSRHKLTPEVQLELVSLRAMADALGLRYATAGSISATLRELGVVRRHEWLVRRWLLALAAEGVIELDGDSFQVCGVVPESGVVDLAELQECLRLPVDVARLHAGALTVLPQLLRDEITVGELLAPIGTEQDAIAGEGLSLLTDELDDACANLFLRKLISIRRDLRAVEIGGGTGRLTDAILSEVPRAADDYLFTDVSEYVRRVAAAARPQIWTAALDVNEDFVAQGFPNTSADVVIAGHSLHHAVNIGRALTRIRDLLEPGGELLITAPVGDDLAALTSTHFLHSPAQDREVLRGGDIHPPERLWRVALRATGFSLLTSMSVGGRSPVRHHLFHAVREAI
ncbi:class I SAM-dependent methyltransferase [Lentzea sp. JNUCC 0626]|uniref:class I SAM-dependent methyltransferase n=1 Tax=Lentzea sp. JNUCC 0626 TaxID=3367513 RepID=UPI00374924AF